MKYLFVFCVLFSFSLNAQDGWKWPEGEKMFKLAQEKQAYYKVLMGQDKYPEALSVLKWLYTNNADLNPSIYIDGTKCAEEVMKTATGARLSELQDTSLWMYDMRIKYWKNEASVLDRKAYAAFKYFYKVPARYPQLIELYDKAFESNGAGISTFNLLPYMTIAKYANEWKLKEMPADKVLDIHTILTNVIDEKAKKGEEMAESRNTIDALLASLEGLLTCSFIETSLVPRMKTNPKDLNTAKKIFKYSLTAKCTDQEYFLKAAELIGENEPSFAVSKFLGDRRLANGENEQAMIQFEKAMTQAVTAQDKYEILLSQAKATSKLGQKTKARNFAREAITIMSNEKEPYNIIGNLYFTSFDECAGKSDMAKDRAVYIAAYNMYQKAGNSAQMKASEQQFPSAEDLFSKGYSEGDEMMVGCWINEKVILKKR